MKKPINFFSNTTLSMVHNAKREKAAPNSAPSKQPPLWRRWHDLVSLGVKDTESLRGWARKRRGEGRRVCVHVCVWEGGTVEEVG